MTYRLTFWGSVVNPGESEAERYTFRQVSDFTNIEDARAAVEIHRGEGSRDWSLKGFGFSIEETP